MPEFKDMSTFTLKAAASGSEEIQVSDTEKINTRQVAALALSQQLTGFTALTGGKPAITATTTIMAAIQSLYAMAGSGKIKVVSDGADQTGMVAWNGTSASGFVINVNEQAIYVRSQWTQSNPDTVTDANWIAGVKSGTKIPFAAAAQNPNMGDLPTNSRLKFVDNKNTILGMLKMLTAAANIGRLRIVSANPATGASGKPELAFIVNIVQGTNAETAGTNGLQIFHLTNDFLRVIPSSSIGMAWPTLQTLTDEDVIKKLNSTASGDWGGLGTKLPWTGGSIQPIHVVDFTVINEIWPAKLTPGTTVPFYAEGEMYSAPSGATDIAYVGQVILNADFATSGMATVVAYGNKAGRMYHAQLDFNGQSIDWFPSPVGTLTLTTFTTLTANASVSNMKIGEMLGFYSSNGGSTSGPGASPLFGYIQKTSSSQVNIFAYTIDGKKSWLGYNAGSNVTWTPVGGASGGAPMLSRVDINDFGDYDTLHAILEQSGDMVAIFADYPTNDPAGSTGAYVGTAQFDNDYSDAIIYDVLNVMTNTRYQGYVSSAGQVVWTGARAGITQTWSIADFTPASLFSAPYNFHLYPSGTMIPIEGSQQAEQGPFPESVYETAGYIMVQYGDNHTSALRQVMVVLYEVGTIAGQPGRMAYATISKGGLNPRWQIIGDSQWLWTGDRALTANTTASLPLTDYTRRTGDRLEIYYAYLGGGTEGHITGFNNAVSVMYNPAETLTQSFFTLVTSGGSASQLEAQFEFRMNGSNLQITGRNLSTGGVNVVSQFRIKGVKLVR
nr:MAG TPA: hypothetical protein [Herelleviridae sp.]